MVGMFSALNNSQTETLSNFCNDIAKGLFLGVAVNQVLSSGASAEAKIFMSVGGVVISFSFLYLALLLKTKE